MLAQRRPDEQVYVGPTSVSNVGPTESTTEKQRWPNVVMLSGTDHSKVVVMIWFSCHILIIKGRPSFKKETFNFGVRSIFISPNEHCDQKLYFHEWLHDVQMCATQLLLFAIFLGRSHP